MLILDSVSPHTLSSRPDHPVPVPVKTALDRHPVSISAGRAKGVRKTKNLAKHPCASVTWYESEDRTLPSVSSF